MNRTIILLAAALLVVFSACRDNLPPAPDTVDVSLVRGSWRLVSIQTDAIPEAIDPSIAITLVLDSTTFSGRSVCNSYGGVYTIGTSSIAIDSIMMTKIACSGEKGELERKYVGHLETVETYFVSETVLRLYANDGSTILNYVRATTFPEPVDTTGEIRERNWLLTKIEGTQTIDVPAQPAVWLRLDREGGSIGIGPCSEYSARHALDSAKKKLSFRDFRSLRLGPGCTNELLEELYFEQLQKAVNYRREESTLLIFTSTGATLHYRLVPSVREIPPSAPFEGRPWQLRQIVENRVPQPVKSERPITILFGSERFTGIGPCARYHGGFTVEGTRLTVAGLIDPNGNCQQRQLEERYIDLLARAAYYRATDTQLVIQTADGALLVYGIAERLEPPGDSIRLVGPVWRFISMTKGRQILLEPNVDSRIKFKPNGRYDGFALCNAIEGSYEADEFALEIIGVEHRRDECSETLAKEDRYIETLERAQGYQIDGDRLTIFSRSETNLNYIRIP